MAENHAEDAPLLEGLETPGTGGASPETTASYFSQSCSRAEKQFAEMAPPWPPSNVWRGSMDTSRLQVPSQGGSPQIPSQGSMDSGCECDTGEIDTSHWDTLVPVGYQDKSVNPPPTFGTSRISPLSPSQPSSSGFSSPGCSSGTGPYHDLDQSRGVPLEIPMTLVPGSYQQYHQQTRLCPYAKKDAIHDMEVRASRSPSEYYCFGQGLVGIARAPSEASDATSHFKFKLGAEEDDDVNAIRDVVEGASCLDVPRRGREGSLLSPAPDDLLGRVPLSQKSLSKVPSYSKADVLSASSSTSSLPMCRICHNPQGDPETLISPCRCDGTMKFIHQGCLMKWLEVSSKKSKKTPSCELCNYQFNRHKKFQFRDWKLPPCSRKDKILHLMFLVSLVVMATCAAITVICFKQDHIPPRKDDAELTQSEIVTLTCGVLFFLAFFVAMYVEVKAKDTLYRLFTTFLYQNQTWKIDDYDKGKDIQLTDESV